MERNSKRQRDENTFDFIHLVAYLINSVVINEVFISFVTTLEDWYFLMINDIKTRNDTQASLNKSSVRLTAGFNS